MKSAKAPSRGLGKLPDNGLARRQLFVAKRLSVLILYSRTDVGGYVSRRGTKAHNQSYSLRSHLQALLAFGLADNIAPFLKESNMCP